MPNKKELTQKLYTQMTYDLAGAVAFSEKEGQRRCLGCMKIYGPGHNCCPYCGYELKNNFEKPIVMLPGNFLSDCRYLVGKLLYYDGYEAAYIGRDLEEERTVILTEFLPEALCSRDTSDTEVNVYPSESRKFEYYQKCFFEEYGCMALMDSPGLIHTFDVFDENNTTYAVSEYFEGKLLSQILDGGKAYPVDKAKTVLEQVALTVLQIHKENILHLGISLSTVMITSEGEVKVFASKEAKQDYFSRQVGIKREDMAYIAEEVVAGRSSKNVSSDVYSIAALFYRMTTGTEPPVAADRRKSFSEKGKDSLKRIDKCLKGLTKSESTAISNALQVYQNDRTANIESLMKEMQSSEKVKEHKSAIRMKIGKGIPKWLKVCGIAAASVSVALIIFVAVGGFRLFDRKEQSLEKYGMVSVPNLIESDFNSVESELLRKGFRLQIENVRSSSYIEAGIIVSQNPERGEQLPYGSVISVVISAGSGSEIVPDIRGFNKDAAVTVLQNLGYRVSLTEAQSSQYAAGVVISQSVNAGTSLIKGGEIVLNVSKGNNTSFLDYEIKMPELYGKKYDDVRKDLYKDGVFLVIEGYGDDSDEEEGIIVSQSPAKGENVKAGSTVTVKVSGRKENIIVPDVKNMKADEAEKILENAGFEMKTEKVSSQKVCKGVIVRQSIPEGTSVPYGKAITVEVCDGFGAVVPSVTGKSYEEAKEDLYLAGFAVSVSTDGKPVNKKAVVTAQSVSAGTMGSYGDGIILTLDY